MVTAWHALSPGKQKCHSLRGLRESKLGIKEQRERQKKGTGKSEETQRWDRYITFYLCSKALTLSVERLHHQIHPLASASIL